MLKLNDTVLPEQQDVTEHDFQASLGKDDRSARWFGSVKCGLAGCRVPDSIPAEGMCRMQPRILLITGVSLSPPLPFLSEINTKTLKKIHPTNQLSPMEETAPRDEKTAVR